VPSSRLASGKFDPGKDHPNQRWRGSAVIHRRLDPENQEIPDYFQSDLLFQQPSLEAFYDYKVLQIQQVQ